jgi:hypothetical protein
MIASWLAPMRVAWMWVVGASWWLAAPAAPGGGTWGVGGAGEGGPDAAISPDAILGAIAVHDARLRSLEWRQQFTVRLNDAMPRLVIQESTEGFDELGRWYLKMRRAVVPETLGEVTYLENAAAGDDEGCMGIQRPDAAFGTVGFQSTFGRCLYPTPLVLLGRWFDVRCDCPLSDVLRGARRMQIVHADETVVRLRAWLPLNHCSSYVDVDCDPTREFIPIRLEQGDFLLDSPVMTLTTTEMTRVDGVWIPLRGTKVVWQRLWTDDQLRAMMDLVVREGYP